LSWFEFESGIFQLFYTIICSCGESRLLLSWCVDDRCDMMGSDKDRDRIGDLVQKIGNGQAQVRYSVAG
jgi:hypothetical protein